MRPLASRLPVWLLVLSVSAGFAFSDEPPATSHLRVTFQEAGGPSQVVSGRILVTDQQGGLLLEDAAGVYWSVTSDQMTGRESVADEFQPATAKEQAAVLRSALGDDAEIVTTKHYVIASRASRAYTQWCGALFERLHSGFLEYWERAKFPLQPGDAPLPVLILATRAQFADYAQKDGAAVVAGSCGYYSARTNRIVLFDLTSEGGNGRPLGESASREEITRRLAGAQANIATVVHEAVHQLAFNTGLQTRYADNPMWVTEGLAMFFETPDLRSANGWKSIGKVNGWRLAKFREFQSGGRAADSLTTLLQNEDRFRDPEQALDAYAESWALVHFLATTRREELVRYLKQLSKRPRLIFADPQERLADIRANFGEDLLKLDRDLAKQSARWKSAP